MWLTVAQLPIKSAWQDASLALREFNWSYKHCIHLSTTNTICFSRFVCTCPHLHQSRFPSNKWAAEAWIYLVSFFFVQAQTEMAEEWWSDWLYSSLKYFRSRNFREFWPFSRKFKTQKIMFWPIRESLCSRNFSRFSCFLKPFFNFFLDQLFPPKFSLVLAQICSTPSGLFVAQI